MKKTFVAFKSYLYLSSACLLVALAGGCQSLNPYVLSIDPPPPADRYEKMVLTGEKKEKVAVHVYRTKHEYGEDIANELYAKLSESIGSLAFFELVPRGDADPLVIEAMLSGRNEEVLPPADYVISAKAVTVNVVEQKALNLLGGSVPIQIQNNGNNARMFTVSLSINFQFFQCAQNRTIKTKTISRTGQALEEGVQEWLINAVRGCAQEFAQTLGGRYAPAARVLQTRGDHEVAMISLGAGYGLTDDTEVNFFTYSDNSPFIESDKRIKNVVGTGRVFLVEEDAAWVEVFNYDRVGVEAGMNVEVILNQKNEFRWRYFFRKIGNCFKY